MTNRLDKKNESNNKRSWRQRFIALANYSPLTLAASLFLCGIIFWGGFNTAMQATNTETFCISCHEMRDNVYREYRKTVHYNNRTGVRATCPDCHVPKDWVHMFKRKISATNELFHSIMGSIDTPEKFAAKRLQLAQYVWADMRDSQSRECRNCHDLKYMQLKQQRKRARVTHKRANKEKRPCIDCHIGIAHKIARDFDKDGKLHEQFHKEKRPCSDCHKGMALPADW